MPQKGTAAGDSENASRSAPETPLEPSQPGKKKKNIEFDDFAKRRTWRWQNQQAEARKGRPTSCYA